MLSAVRGGGWLDGGGLHTAAEPGALLQRGARTGDRLKVTRSLPAGLAAGHMKATQQEDSLETRSGDFADVN